jgi:hypothetical protein
MEAVAGPDTGPAVAAEECGQVDGIEHAARTAIAVALWVARGAGAPYHPCLFGSFWSLQNITFFPIANSYL